MKYWTIRTCFRAVGQRNVSHPQEVFPMFDRVAQSSPAARQWEGGRKAFSMQSHPPASLLVILGSL